MWRLRRYRIQILVLLIATLLLVRVSLYLLLPDPASRLNGGFSQIKMGMTPGEVEHILGKPNKDDPDVKVWVNTNSSVYHCPGTRWYGKTRQGEYMTQKQAQDKGYRPAYGKVCE